jgi:hypothetical protein
VVAELWLCLIRLATSSPECPGVFDTELQTPLSNGLVADYDPALC